MGTRSFVIGTVIAAAAIVVASCGAPSGPPRAGATMRFVPRRPAPDVAALEARCDRRDRAACRAVAELYTFGTEIRRDLRKASAAWQHACDLGEPIGCPRAASIARLAGDAAACERTKDPDRCFAAGMGYAEFDRRAALPGLERACRARRDEACSYLLRARILLGDESAVGSLELRCLVDDRLEDCIQVARHLGGTDPRRAMSVLDKACALDSADACVALGRALRDRGAPPDQVRSRFDQACRLAGATSPGCRELAN